MHFWTKLYDTLEKIWGKGAGPPVPNGHDATVYAPEFRAPNSVGRLELGSP